MLYIDSTSNRRFGLGVHCAGGLFVIAACVGVYALQYAPTLDATETARLEIGEMQQSLRKAPAIARDYKRLSEQLQTTEQRLARIRRRVPSQAAESEFFGALADAAQKDGVVINNFSTGLPQQMAGYSQRELTIAGSASYESVCRFIDRIGGLPRLSKVVGLDVSSEADGNGVYPVTITIAIYYDLIAHSGGKK